MADRVKEGIDVMIWPPQAGADRPRPHRLPDPLLVRDRLLGLRHAAGVSPVVAHRADPPGEGGVHGLPEHPPSRRAEAGGEEAAKLPRRRGRAAGGRAGRLRRRRGRPDDGVGRGRSSAERRKTRRRRWSRSSPRPGTPRQPPRNTWWTTTGRRWRSSRRPSRSTATGPTACPVLDTGATATTTTASGRRSTSS